MRSDDPLANPEELLRRVYAYVAYRVRDHSEAEDITSETFERALRYRDTYDPRKGEPIGWLLGIARRLLYDASLRPQHEHSEQDAPAAGDLEGEIVSRVALSGALAALNPSDRDLIALRYGADLSTREIGRLLEMRANAVDVALSRARARLKTILESEPRSDEEQGPRLAGEAL